MTLLNVKLLICICASRERDGPADAWEVYYFTGASLSFITTGRSLWFLNEKIYRLRASAYGTATGAGESVSLSVFFYTVNKVKVRKS